LQTLANLVFIAEADDYLQHLEPLALAAKAHGGRFTTRASPRSAFRKAWPSCGRPTATSPGFQRLQCAIR